MESKDNATNETNPATTFRLRDRQSGKVLELAPDADGKIVVPPGTYELLDGGTWRCFTSPVP